MNQCRNCGAVNPRNLGFIGTLAPFFLKRVMQAEIVIRESVQPRKRVIQRLTLFLQRILSRIHRVALAVELQSCHACSFVQTKSPFSEEAIARLYADYRSDTYNHERIQYEPEHALRVGLVGEHTEGGIERREANTTWLKSKINLDEATMLDYGGSDGRFLPDIPASKYVFDVSDIEAAPEVVRISEESRLGTYDYVQISHVIEHVVQPLQLIQHVASFVTPGGYLYIEVPQDLDSALIQRLQSDRPEGTITIHEHINFYSPLAVEKLIEAAGMEVVALADFKVETPLQTEAQTYVRAIAKRGASTLVS